VVSIGESGELERDVGDGVVLLHLEDGDPVEPAAVDGGEDGVVVVGGGCSGGGEVGAEGVDDGVGGGELAAEPGEDCVLGEGVGDEHWGRDHRGSIGE